MNPIFQNGGNPLANRPKGFFLACVAPHKPGMGPTKVLAA
jgi:hypothetical protein